MQSYLNDATQTYNATVRVISDARLLLIRSEDFADRRTHLVPDGDAPARGTVLRDAQLAADRRPAAAAARPRCADRRADPRAEQPGGRRGPRELRAAREVRRDAQQARDAGARRDRPASCSSCSSTSRRRRCGRCRRTPSSRRCRSRSARTSSPTGSTSTASRRAGSSHPSSSVRAPRPSSSTSSRPGRRRTCSRARCGGLSYTLETELLLDEVTDSVTRISILGGGGEAVLPHGPRALRAGRHPRRPQEHPGDDGRQARPGSAW